MNGLPYYKAYPRDFIEGTIGMDIKIKGVYRLVLDLIYMQGGELPDDSRYISGLLGCSVKMWNSAREELLRDDKIQLKNGYLTNYRASKEIESYAKYQQKQSENRSRPNKNNNLAEPPSFHTEPYTKPDITTLKGAGAKHDLNGLENKLREAANLEHSISPALMQLSDPIRWIENGCDLDLDIIPTLRAKSRGRVSSWSYFSNPVFEARDKRLAPAPDVQAIPQRKSNANPSVAEIAMRRVTG